MKFLFVSLLLGVASFLSAQPCTTNNAAGCVCADGRDTCYLLPDITISWFAILHYDGGPSEYSQSGNGGNNGRLRITGSTPNTGFGPFTVRGTNYFICGSDTIFSSTGNVTCPDGSTPTNLLHQRVYKKVNGTMTYEDRWAGGQTYHPTHGHNHVDDWVVFTLRQEDPLEPDTLKWPIIGEGAKIGFCLMDYGTCNYYNGHCRDRQQYGTGTIKNSSNTANYGLGGGQYNCSPVEQGISVGYTDIYSKQLDGMWINIPPGTCNGDYWIVAEVDPRNHFLESDKTNNWTAVPFTLTKQVPSGQSVTEITVDGSLSLCNGTPVTLHAMDAEHYLWSTGDTTKSIEVFAAGNYIVETVHPCGTGISVPVAVDVIPSAITAVWEDTLCDRGIAELSAAGNGSIHWYETPDAQTPVFSGNTFNTPHLQNTATYFIENVTTIPALSVFSAPHEHSGTSVYSGTQYNGYIQFDCLSAFTLRSVKVETDYPGTRVIEWRNSGGTVLADTTVFIGSGTSRIDLNFNIAPGVDYQLGTNESVNQTNFGHASPALKRTGSGVSYPYLTPGIVSLNGSNLGAGFYYYFYDWEIGTAPLECASSREPVSAVVIPLPAVSFSGLDTLYQYYDSAVTLSGFPAGGVFSGTGISGNIFSPSMAGIGVHDITYSFMDEFGCHNESSQAVRVKKGQLTASVAGDADLCDGDSTLLTAAGGSYFEWSTGDTIASIVVRPSVTTQYSVTVSDQFAGSDAGYVTVEVHPIPVTDFSGLGALYNEHDAPAHLTGIPAGGLFSGAGMNGNVFSPANAGAGGPYAITYFFENEFGCSHETIKNVWVEAETVSGIPQQTSNEQLRIYPNPANGTFHIELPESGGSAIRVRIISAIGRIITEYSTNNTGLLTLDISQFPDGIFLAEISTSKKVYLGRMVKKGE